jgi:hypothetical protein
MGMGFETERAEMTAFWPGLDCAINCNIPLVNVATAFPTHKSVGVSRFKHPGAGAISPYRSGSTKVIRDIAAGSELFKDYGDGWYETKNMFYMPDPYRTCKGKIWSFRFCFLLPCSPRCTLHRLWTLICLTCKKHGPFIVPC